jgi:hypothetical protein
MAKKNRKAAVATEETAAAKKRGKLAKTPEQVAAHGAQRLVALIKPTENPCGEGTFCRAQVQAALTSKTVAEAQEKLATMKTNPTPKRALELGWLLKKQFVKIA